MSISVYGLATVNDEFTVAMIESRNGIRDVEGSGLKKGFSKIQGRKVGTLVRETDILEQIASTLTTNTTLVSMPARLTGNR